jgi:hypothetical protein
MLNDWLTGLMLAALILLLISSACFFQESACVVGAL